MWPRSEEAQQDCHGVPLTAVGPCFGTATIGSMVRFMTNCGHVACLDRSREQHTTTIAQMLSTLSRALHAIHSTRCTALHRIARHGIASRCSLLDVVELLGHQQRAAVESELVAHELDITALWVSDRLTAQDRGSGHTIGQGAYTPPPRHMTSDHSISQHTSTMRSKSFLPTPRDASFRPSFTVSWSSIPCSHTTPTFVTAAEVLKDDASLHYNTVETTRRREEEENEKEEEEEEEEEGRVAQMGVSPTLYFCDAGGGSAASKHRLNHARRFSRSRRLTSCSQETHNNKRLGDRMQATRREREHTRMCVSV
jgi:hypothetical protein